MASRLNIEDAIYIETDGQVGINVQSPSDQFEVNGTMSGNVSTGDQWLKQQTGGANKTIHYMSTTEGAASITKYGNDIRFENPHDTVRATLDNGGTFSVLGSSNLNSLNVTGNFSAAYGKVQMDSTAVYFEQNIIQLGAYPTLNKAIIDSQGSNIRLSSPGNTGALEVNSDGNTVLNGNLQSKGAYMNTGFAATDTRPALNTSSIGQYEIRGYGTNGTASNEGFLRLSSGGGSNSANQSYIDISGYNTNSEMDDTITFGTSGAERFRVNTSGNIGIGTTEPESLLDISTPSTTTPMLTLRSGNGNVVVNDGAQVQFGYSGNASYNHYIQTRHNSVDSDNAIDFYICDGTENNTLTSGSNHVMSLNSGKMGLGISQPNEMLELRGGGATLLLTGAGSNANLSFFNTDSNNYMNWTDRTPLGEIKFTGEESVTGDTGDDYEIAKTFCSIQARIHTDNGGSSYGALQGGFGFYTNDGDGSSSGSAGNSLTEKMTLAYDGRLGLNSFSPAGMIDISTGTTVGDSTKNASLKFNNYDAGARVVLWDDGASVNDYAGLGKTSSALDICIPSSGNFFAFKANGSELVRIEGGGDVGIGTSSPDRKLDVNGTFKVRGNDGFSGAVCVYNCERNGNVTTSSGSHNKQMAWGNGSSSTHGVTMPKNGTVLGITFSATANSNCQLHLTDNNAETGDYISTTSTNATNIAEGMHNFSAGDRLGLKLKIISGTTSNIVGSFIVRFD